MKNLRGVTTLIKVLLHNAEMKMPKDGSRKRLYTALGVIAVTCIMLPCCFVVGYISYMMTASLMVSGAKVTEGLLAEIHIMSAFSMIFGILVIFNVLFFSSDREHLVPLPLRPEEILTAKFFYAYFAESVMEFLILLSMFIGFCIAYGPKPVAILCGLVGTVVIPLLPLTYCGILSLLLMGLLRNVKSSKFFGRISTLLLLLFVGLFLLSFRGMESVTLENYLDSIVSGNNLFTDVLNKIFFVSPVLMHSIEANNILFMFLYILLNILCVAVMIGLGHFLYQEGLYTVGKLGSGAKKKKADLGKKKEDGIFAAYVKKEWKVLMRTKAYRVNCVLINLLWPIATFVLFISGTLDYIVKRFETGQEWPIVLLSIVVMAVGFIASAMNSIASTAFTREGAHLSLVKYIPVPYKVQCMAKGTIAFVVSFVPLYIAVIIAGIFLKMPVWLYFYYAFLLAAVIITTSFLGMVLDSTAPHSAWDDEYSALRGNLNTFFNMAVVMVAAVILCGGGFLLYFYLPINGLWFHIGAICIMCLMAAILFKVGLTKTVRNMQIM